MGVQMGGGGSERVLRLAILNGTIWCQNLVRKYTIYIYSATLGFIYMYVYIDIYMHVYIIPSWCVEMGSIFKEKVSYNIFLDLK